MAKLTPQMVADLPTTGPSDPIAFYQRPWVGKLFLHRINLGLTMIPPGTYARALEVGYGAGALFPALRPLSPELHGIDLDADAQAVTHALSQRGIHVHLKKASVYDLPYPDSHFDLAVCFSVFEHLDDPARGLGEVHRALRPGGLFLLGMPAVNRVMEAGFHLIGFREINHHHITRPQEVRKLFRDAGFKVRNHRRLGVKLPMATLYYNWLLERA